MPAECLIIWDGTNQIMGFGYQKLGRVYPIPFPLDRCCITVIKLDRNTVRTVLEAAYHGQTDIDPDVPVGEHIYVAKLNSGYCVSVV